MLPRQFNSIETITKYFHFIKFLFDINNKKVKVSHLLDSKVS